MSSVLGVSLPEKWGASRLKNLTRLLNRGSAPTYVADGRVRAISQAANQDGGLDWSRTRFHDFDGDATKLKGYLQPEDLLINSTGTGTLGRVGYFSGAPDGIPCMADSHVTIARTKSDELHPRFAYYWLCSQPFQEYVYAALAVGATNQIELNRESLGDAPVPVPPLEEQRRIADFLDAEIARMDKMIVTAQRMRTVLAERKSAHRALILRGAHKSGGRHTHPMLGDLPDTWKVLPLRRLLPRIGVGVVVDPSSYFSDEGVPFLRGSNILPEKFHLEGVKLISPSDSRRLWRSQLFEGDVVVVRAGDPGRAAVVTRELNGANCASVLVLKKGKILLPEYLATYFNSALGAAYVDSVRYGAAQEQINVSHVVDFMVPAPSIAEQKEIITELHRSAAPGAAMDQLLAKQTAVLAERRQALITAAVTGQIDVSTASGRGIEE